MNGYRIELAEVELAFSASPLVEQAVVLVRHGQLAAYVTLGSGSGGVANIREELTTFVGKSLTTYMIPK